MRDEGGLPWLRQVARTLAPLLLLPSLAAAAQQGAAVVAEPHATAATRAAEVPVAPVNEKPTVAAAAVLELAVTGASGKPPAAAATPAETAVAAPAAPVSPAALSAYVQSARQKLPSDLLAGGRVAAVSGAGLTQVDASSVERALERGQPLIVERRARADTVQLPATADRPAGRTVVRLPQQIIVPAADGSGAIEADVVVENLTGLVYQPQENEYRAALQVALISGDLPAGTKLAPPVRFFVSAVGARAIEPLSVLSGELLDWHPVTIHVLEPGERFLVRVGTGGAAGGSDFELPIVRPTVQMSAAPPRIVGWGIGTSRITLQSRALAGRTVLLEAAGGELTPAAVTLDANGVGIATLRSQGSGEVTLQARGVQLEGRPVQFTSPLPFVLLAAAGGVLGAALGRRRNQRWPKVLALGAGTGLLMTGAYFVGVNWLGDTWPGLATAGEAVVAVLGALGALAGVRRLKA